MRAASCGPESLADRLRQELDPARIAGAGSRHRDSPFLRYLDLGRVTFQTGMGDSSLTAQSNTPSTHEKPGAIVVRFLAGSGFGLGLNGCGEMEPAASVVASSPHPPIPGQGDSKRREILNARSRAFEICEPCADSGPDACPPGSTMEISWAPPWRRPLRQPTTTDGPRAVCRRRGRRRRNSVREGVTCARRSLAGHHDHQRTTLRRL